MHKEQKEINEGKLDIISLWGQLITKCSNNIFVISGNFKPQDKIKYIEPYAGHDYIVKVVPMTKTCALLIIRHSPNCYCHEP